MKNYITQDLHSSSLTHLNPKRIAFLEYTWNYVYCILRAKRCPQHFSPLSLRYCETFCRHPRPAFLKPTIMPASNVSWEKNRNLWLFSSASNLLIIHTMQLLYKPLVFYLEISLTFTAILIKTLKIKRVIGLGYYPILLGLHPESELYTWRSVTLELWLLSCVWQGGLMRHSLSCPLKPGHILLQTHPDTTLLSPLPLLMLCALILVGSLKTRGWGCH